MAKTQKQKCFELLSDRQIHPTYELVEAVGHRFSCAVLDLRADGYDIETIDHGVDEDGSRHYSYRMA